MTDIIQDIIFAWRNALKKPGTSLLIIVTLALGIGANTAMFSIAWHVLLAPLPYADGGRLVMLKQNLPERGRLDAPWSVATVADYRDQNTMLTDVLAYRETTYTLLGNGEPYFANTAVVNWNYLAVFGIQPLHGRSFIETDDVPGAERVMLLGYDNWLRNYGAEVDIVGTSIETNEGVYTVIGVLPPVPAFPRGNDVWIPAASDRFMSDPRVLALRAAEGGGGIMHVIAKLRPGVSLDEASRDLETITARLKAAYPDNYPPEYIIELRFLKDELVSNSARIVMLLLGLTTLIVLIACANVANLKFAEISARTQELAVREAVGGNPARLRRQLLTESLVIALAGGLLGLGCAYSVLDLFIAFAAGYSPLASEIRMNGPVLLFALTISCLTGFLSGSFAAFSNRDINKALKEGGDKVTTSLAGTRRRQLLLLTQLALAFVMLTASGLIVLSLYRLNNQDTGYETKNILNAYLELNSPLYGGPEKTFAFVDRLISEVEAIPGVDLATIASDRLLQESMWGVGIAQVETTGPAQTVEPISMVRTHVTQEYFSTLGIPLLEGRTFAETDDANAEKVVIINESFAKRYFPEGDALGKRVGPFGSQSWSTIIGVASDVRPTNIDQLQGNAMYTHLRQERPYLINLFVRTRIDPALLADDVKNVIHNIDPELAVASVLPLETVKASWLAPREIIAALTAMFGLLAVVVALAGVIGVVSCTISQRVREIGIHMAIGANPMHVRNGFISQGLQVYLVGLAAGLILMLFAAPLLAPLLYETDAYTPLVYLASACVLTLAVTIALYVTARAASVMSPAEALRSE